MSVNPSTRLNDIIGANRPKLILISDKEAKKRPAPGKWSSIEILGHLIDSAINNTARFVRTQSVDAMIFDGYDQENWVSSQKYQDREWLDIVNLWASLNTHLAQSISHISTNNLDREYPVHNLDKIAFKGVDKTEPATLRYFINDYLDHIEHHLIQIYNIN